MQNIKLNLVPGSVMPVVNVSQYDKARQFSLTVYEGAATYSLTGKDVQIRGTKPDGNGFAYDSTYGVVSVSGSTVTISTTQQMTAVGGQTMAELRITSGDTILGTLNFVLMVEPSALSDDTPISETDIPAIERDFEAALAEAEADALKAEGYAVGTQDGTPAQSGEPYYQDNAKYYKEQAEAAASDVFEKYPKIVSDYWYVWDIDTNQYVNTGVRAKGTQGDPGAPGQGVPAGGTTGQVLKKASNSDYDTEWGMGGGGASALDDLTDVDITTPADGDLLQYNATSQKWENSDTIPDELTAMQENGAYNWLPNDAASQTINGVTFTVNADKSVTVNGTATANAIFNLHAFAETPFFFGKNVRLEGCPSGGSYSTYLLRIYAAKAGNVNANDLGNGETFEWGGTGSNITAFIFIGNGYTANNLTFKPMLYDAHLVNPPYQPFTMTNRELTDAETPVSYTTTLNTTNFTSGVGNIECIKIGKLVYVNVDGIQPINAGTDKNVATGLPKAAVKAAGGVTIYTASNDVNMNGYIYILNNQTTLKAHIKSTTGKMWGSFVYVAAE